MATVEEITQQGRELFSKRGGLLSLWQTLAENFYPERAEFTSSHTLGAEFGAELMSSHPVRARRELGDSISAILRPTTKDWFFVRTEGDWDSVPLDARAWLEKAQSIQRRSLAHHGSMFVQAAKDADHDFVTFGQAVIQRSKNKDGSGLLYRCWHLRDVAWCDDINGAVSTVYRKWDATAMDVVNTFGGRAHPRVHEKMEKARYDKMEIWHCVHPTGKVGKGTMPFESIYLDPANNHIMETVGMPDLGYVIPRWRKLSGTAYAISPATLTALPDARLLQAMVTVLLEAGEKAVNPPTVANKNVFGGAFSIYAGGTTWADMSDGRIQDHYGLLPTDKSGIPLGRDMAADLMNQIDDSMYLSKLRLPPAPSGGRTAYEVSKITEENIRQVLPLFEPMEMEYNAPLMEGTFDALLNMGAFGPLIEIPKSLQGASIQFTFESPLQGAIEAIKRQTLSEAVGVVAEAQQVDARSKYLIDVTVAARDVLNGIATPAAWIRSETEVKELSDGEAEEQMQAQSLIEDQRRANLAQTAGDTKPVSQ